jgi:segregation and condensation protein B
MEYVPMNEHWELDTDRPADESDLSEDDSVDENDIETPSEDLGEWAGDDLEAAYLKAMSALEASDLEFPSVPPDASPPSPYVDREINELNRLYAAEGRPYEIRLGEGGYRLTLREEFERIRHKVYGLGPKEVRLSQEVLEVLAVVAYHQPIKQTRVEELGKPGCGPLLRQLVRRELLAVERDPAHPREVSYKTTPRFLSLFGIRKLDELPRHEQVSYK